jgi:transmembrane sensor
MGRRDEAEQRQREAFAWVVRLVPGNVTTADLKEFERWSGQSPDHARAFVEARDLSEAAAFAGRTVLERDDASLRTRSMGGVRQRVERRVFLGGMLTAAAAAAGYVVIRPPLDLWPSLPELLEADYRTGTGEQRRLTLADNVSVEMNTQTSITMRPKKGDADRIELLSGESVIATEAQAFEVIAGPGQTLASHAAFNVRRDGGVVRVTCLDGTVQIACGTTTASLGARQQVSYSDAGLGPVIAIDPAVVTAWQTGFMIFHDTPLSEVIVEANRYRHGRIILMNAKLGRHLVNARFRLDRIDELVTKVTNAFDATATSLPGGMVILS